MSELVNCNIDPVKPSLLTDIFEVDFGEVLKIELDIACDWSSCLGAILARRGPGQKGGLRVERDHEDYDVESLVGRLVGFADRKLGAARNSQGGGRIYSQGGLQKCYSGFHQFCLDELLESRIRSFKVEIVSFDSDVLPIGGLHMLVEKYFMILGCFDWRLFPM